ncbi:HD domain-containing protein [Salipiger bermudensis]|uniref:HD domain-containing protein n=1 Tax=Salipiger bermudensis TaxID=344736 RepID=UPI001CD25143|nr:ATP-binding protein [Salipiger bermudensis]MCA1288675.1 ATP-binding protein [Salipiger bermudensis]
MALKFDAEIRAEKATTLSAFPVNLPEVRRVVKDILSTFGANLIFKEYTTHDMSHIDDMLSTVDWIIPEKTKEIMSDGDWLMLVLSIYFHDMGLVVTEQEFENRSKSTFTHFCNNTLFKGDGGGDYRAKVEGLPEGERDRILYQEFVRYHHATRIKVWLTGEMCFELGYCKAQIELVEELLAPLGEEFRHDLALVCESHNLDDIENIKKYRQDHPYGNTPREEVNLQYISALLRTIDLIQITERRAPSALYRLIDPSDPISQLEWAKQNAVRSVRPQKQKDDDGAVLHTKQPDTIEVFARFGEEASFFGLNAYLRYANDQVKSTFDALDKTKGTAPKNYQFPWRKIDDTNVKAAGFEQEPFGFEIDQEKILDLLTGHTLYNDSNVVVRELTQNAVDAVRLKFHETADGSKKLGRIKVNWDSENNELTIVDNGTGMSQSTIENHLLKVGSSKYQDPKFKEEFPNFTPISRFGIGVLTAFMVADKVEITTVSPDDEKARKISLRSVHGKYLIKILEKSADDVKRDIGDHGSKFVLRFRASARKMDIRRTLESYVLFPRCKVTLTIDGGEPISIGFDSPKDALTDYLSKETTVTRFAEEKVEVREKSVNGTTIAYAMSYSSHYKDWQFIRVPERNRVGRSQEKLPPIMTCVEGIVVQSQLVGGIDPTLLAVVNMTGAKAPKTNVARSALETTGEFDSAVQTINRLLLDAVEAESRRLVDEEEYSLTWAVEQMPRMMHPVVAGRGASDSRKIEAAKEKELYKTKMFLVEESGKRSVCSANDLLERGDFWMVDSMLLTSTEQFIREAKREVSRLELLELVYGDNESSLKDLFVVPNAHTPVCRSVVQSLFDISHFRGQIQERRLDVKWSSKSDLWFSKDQIFNALMEIDGYQDFELYRHMEEISRRNRSTSILYSVFAPRGKSDIESEGLDGFLAVKTIGNLYLLPGSDVANFFADAPSSWENDIDFLKSAYFTMVAAATAADRYYKEISEIFAELRKSMPEQLLAKCEGSLDQCQSLWDGVTKLDSYDPFSWRQRPVDWNATVVDMR